MAFAAPLVIGLMAASSAQAVPLDFGCITNNLPADCSVGEAQMTAEVIDIGGGQIQIDFMNAGPSASSITDVYFDDSGAVLGGIDALIDADENGGDAGVDFSMGAAPPILPGGNAVNFNATAGLSIDSDPPVQPNGVNPGETLGVIYDLGVGSSFADVVAALTDGSLRLGIHVQGFGGGGSESLVNNPVPEPGTALLIGLGLTALSGSRRHA